MSRTASQAYANAYATLRRTLMPFTGVRVAEYSSCKGEHGFLTVEVYGLTANIMQLTDAIRAAHGAGTGCFLVDTTQEASHFALGKGVVRRAPYLQLKIPVELPEEEDDAAGTKRTRRGLGCCAMITEALVTSVCVLLVLLSLVCWFTGRNLFDDLRAVAGSDFVRSAVEQLLPETLRRSI